MNLKTHPAAAQNAEPARILEEGVVRIERLLPGPIERVWAYLVESEKRGKWLAPGSMESRVGAEFKLHFRHQDLSAEQVPVPERFKAVEDGHISHHRVTRFDPPRGLSYTWEGGCGAGQDEGSHVDFDLTEEGERVRLVVVHRRLPDRKEMASVGGGWHAHLAVLEQRLEGHEPGAFWDIHERVAAHYDAWRA